MLSTMKGKCSELKASRCGKLFSSVAMTTQNEKGKTMMMMTRKEIVSAYFLEFSSPFSSAPSLPLLFRAHTHTLSRSRYLFFPADLFFYKLSTFFVIKYGSKCLLPYSSLSSASSSLGYSKSLDIYLLVLVSSTAH